MLPAMSPAVVANLKKVSSPIQSRSKRNHSKHRGSIAKSENDEQVTNLPDTHHGHSSHSSSVLNSEPELPAHGTYLKDSGSISRDSTICGSNPGSSRPSLSTNQSPRANLGRPPVSPHASSRATCVRPSDLTVQPPDLSPQLGFAHSADKGPEVEQLMHMVEVLTHKVQRLRLEASDPACVSEVYQPKATSNGQNEQGPLQKVYQRKGTPHCYLPEMDSAGSGDEHDIRKLEMAQDIPASCPPWGRRNTPAVQCERITQSEVAANLPKKTKKPSDRRHSAPAGPKHTGHKRHRCYQQQQHRDEP